MILFRIWRDLKSDQRQTLYLTATFIFFFYLFLFPAALGLCCCARALSCRALASRCWARSRGRVGSGAEVQGLSCPAGISLPGTGARARGLRRWGAGLRCPAAGVIFPDQGSNPSPLHWQVGSTTGPPGEFLTFIFRIDLLVQKFIHPLFAPTTSSWMVWIWSCNLL